MQKLMNVSNRYTFDKVCKYKSNSSPYTNQIIYKMTFNKQFLMPI